MNDVLFLLAGFYGETSIVFDEIFVRDFCSYKRCFYVLIIVFFKGMSPLHFVAILGQRIQNILNGRELHEPGE